MQQKYSKLKQILICLAAMIILTACRENHSNINLQTVTQTSEKLACEKIFNKSRKSIIELNEILIQTGTIDIIENETVDAAIIHESGKEIILRLDTSQRLGTLTTEIYKGKGYKIILTYEPEQYTHASGYKGTFEIWKGSEHDKFDVQGMVNNL